MWWTIKMILRHRLRRMSKFIYEPKPDNRGGAIRYRNVLNNWTKEEIRDLLIQLYIDDNTEKSWFRAYMIEEKENERLRNILKSDYHNDKSLNNALHMADLEKKVKRQKREIREMQEKAEVFNKRLYATGLIVNCTGCEPGKPFKGEELTDERVEEVSRLAARLKSWWVNHKYREQQNASA